MFLKGSSRVLHVLRSRQDGFTTSQRAIIDLNEDYLYTVSELALSIFLGTIMCSEPPYLCVLHISLDN